MKINSVKEFINSYLERNYSSLEHHYPGINLNRLLNEFLHYSHLKEDEAYLGQGKEFFIHLEEGYPLEYIQKCAYFYRSNFYVDSNVLIPRSETEILVEDSVSYIKKNLSAKAKIAEVGVGSFCIGLSIISELDFPIDYWGGDIEERALEVAMVNHFRLKTKIPKNTNVQLIKCDRLVGVSEKFDLIVSNPPYIRLNEDKDGVHHQANRFEPASALYLKDDTFDSWFDDFFNQAINCLNEKGAFFMEGHEDSLLQLSKIAEKYFEKVKLKNDYTGRLRFLHCYK